MPAKAAEGNASTAPCAPEIACDSPPSLKPADEEGLHSSENERPPNAAIATPAPVPRLLIEPIFAPVIMPDTSGGTLLTNTKSVMETTIITLISLKFRPALIFV